MCHTLRTSSSMKFNMVSNKSHLPTFLMQRSFFGTPYKAYTFPVFKGRDQPLWRVKMKTSCLRGISFQIFLSSNVIQLVPDYTIKGYDGDDFYRKYTIYLEESRLAAEVINEHHESPHNAYQMTRMETVCNPMHLYDINRLI